MRDMIFKELFENYMKRVEHSFCSVVLLCLCISHLEWTIPDNILR